MIEIWKDVMGYENAYKISNTGLVKSFLKNKLSGIILGKNIDTGGYQYNALWSGSSYRNYRVHVLVAREFLPNPENKPQVNHKDGNKLNNNLDNLEWVTISENIKHAYATGLKTNKAAIEKLTKLTETDVHEIRSLKGIHSYKKIGSLFNICPQHVCEIVNRKAWSHV